MIYYMQTPAIICGIVGIFILVAIAFSPVVKKEEKPFVFGAALVGIPLWFLVVYWFCSTGFLVYAWFMTILPFTLILTWYVGRWLQYSCIKE